MSKSDPSSLRRAASRPLATSTRCPSFRKVISRSSPQRPLVVHHQDMRRFFFRLSCRRFRRLHRTSFRPWELENKLRSFFLLTVDHDAPVVCLHNLVNDRQPEPRPALKTRLQVVQKSLPAAGGSSPMPVSRNEIRSQSGTHSIPTVSVPPCGIARTALSQRFQNTCFILLASTRATDSSPLNARTICNFSAAPGFRSSNVSVSSSSGRTSVS